MKPLQMYTAVAAKRKGNAKKIADRQAKLEAARAELTRAEKPIGP